MKEHFREILVLYEHEQVVAIVSCRKMAIFSFGKIGSGIVKQHPQLYTACEY